MARRVTAADLESAVEDLRAVGEELGVEGAEYWVVENPYGPHGLHLLERHHDDGNWVSGNTKLGSYTWSGPAQAHAAVRMLWRALLAARNAGLSQDATARRGDPLSVNP